jgi:tRNA threonylcarbamoyl adenosine modification protein YeaZ
MFENLSSGLGGGEKNGILAVTACLKRCSAALKFSNRVFVSNEEIDAAENLVWLVGDLAKSNGIDIKNICKIITASGPGSFTGIRVAQSFAKATALVLKIPAASISYFDVINYLYENSGGKTGGDKLIVIKSEKGHAYFRKIFTDAPENYFGNNISSEYGVSSFDNFEEKIRSADGKKIVLIGDAAENIADSLEPGLIEDCKNISDFKNAEHLLSFSEQVSEKSRIEPLYINAEAKPTACAFEVELPTDGCR